MQGDALGGGFETAISSDVLIAERGARMGFPEVLFNLFPGMGAYSLLSRKLDSARAERIILSGKIYGAEELYEMGVVDVLAEDLQGEMAVYDHIRRENRSANGYRALRAAKERINGVSYKELIDIAEIWVDAALRLESRDLRMMGRLVARQTGRGRNVSAQRQEKFSERGHHQRMTLRGRSTYSVSFIQVLSKHDSIRAASSEDMGVDIS
ncbi:MAG: crotonase/enoyl-CoA hydratase family protein [Gammaproteobacteria bacterium]